MKTVVVALSGGVDSSVSAYLLKKEGYNVIGLFMKNWHDSSVTISNECPWWEDSNDAMLVAQKIKIPFQIVDLSREYKTQIIDYMFDAYKRGKTPNPDVLCNTKIKFDVFMKIALDLKADYIATGHYCQRGATRDENGNKIYQLKQGYDKDKDQSYFLCQLSQYQLSKSLFPLGELKKEEVRGIAKKINLITAEKKDSQGLCFIGKVRLSDFLQQRLKPRNGFIIEISREDEIFKKTEPSFSEKEEELIFHHQKYKHAKHSGQVVGIHQGAHFFTKGQRKGLAVGGTKAPLFVIETDVKENLIYVGEGIDHPGLYKKVLFIKDEDIHWIREDLKINVKKSMEVLARIRYRQPLEKATLYSVEHGMYVSFENDQSAIQEGQFVAWYLKDQLIGSGVIS